MATRRTFQRKAMVGFTVLALLLASGMAFSIRRLESVESVEVAHIRLKENEITLVERLRWQSELIVSNGRGYLISGSDAFLAQDEDSKRQFNESLDTLRHQDLTPTGRDLAREADRAAREFIRVQEELFEARRRDEDPKHLAHRFETELVPLRGELDHSLARLVEHKERLIDQTYREARERRAELAHRLHGLLGVLLLASFGIAWFFANLLGRSYRQEKLALDSARKAVGARDELMGIVAHDLRNPLGAVMMRAALMRTTAADARTREHARSIESVAKRMELLIRTMLDVTTIEAGKFSVVLAPCAVDDLLRETMDVFTTLADAKQVRIDQVVAERGLVALADRERVLEVLSNLLGNALKFTPHAGRITIAVERRDAMIVFAVSDTGPGIAANDLPHVFDRFWKTSGKKNTGLGLFIAQGIVAAHRGRIWTESVAGQGATFYFTLPMAEPDASEREGQRTGAAPVFE